MKRPWPTGGCHAKNKQTNKLRIFHIIKLQHNYLDCSSTCLFIYSALWLYVIYMCIYIYMCVCVCVCVCAHARARAFEECQMSRPNSQINRPIKFASSCQWPRSLRVVSATARLLGLWVRIPPGAWMAVTCECCVLSGKGIFDGPITCPEESYRVWNIWVWFWSFDREDALAPWKKTSRGRHVVSCPKNYPSESAARCFLSTFHCQMILHYIPI